MFTIAQIKPIVGSTYFIVAVGIVGTCSRDRYIQKQTCSQQNDSKGW